jgi:hypothetical protein
MGLDLHGFKVGFGYAAVRALPSLGYVGPKGAGGNAVFRATRGFVVNEAANDANIGFHGNLSIRDK